MFSKNMFATIIILEFLSSGETCIKFVFKKYISLETTRNKLLMISNKQ